jgi:hypothetical protein
MRDELGRLGATRRVDAIRPKLTIPARCVAPLPLPSIAAMTEKTRLQRRPNSSALEAPDKGAMSWPLVLGLGSLALLWPLAELIGLSDAIGGLTVALMVFAVVAITWIGTVGFCRVSRPVLTLTLAGVVYGGFLVALSAAFGTHPAFGGFLAAGVALFEIGRSALLGSVAGLLARAVQKVVSRG